MQRKEDLTMFRWIEGRREEAELQTLHTEPEPEPIVSELEPAPEEREPVSLLEPSPSKGYGQHLALEPWQKVTIMKHHEARQMPQVAHETVAGDGSVGVQRLSTPSSWYPTVRELMLANMPHLGAKLGAQAVMMPAAAWHLPGNLPRVGYEEPDYGLGAQRLSTPGAWHLLPEFPLAQASIGQGLLEYKTVDPSYLPAMHAMVQHQQAPYASPEPTPGSAPPGSYGGPDWTYGSPITEYHNLMEKFPLKYSAKSSAPATRGPYGHQRASLAPYGPTRAPSPGTSTRSGAGARAAPTGSRAAPSRAAPTASSRAASGRSASGRSASGRSASGRSASGRSASGRSASGRSASGRGSRGGGRSLSGNPFAWIGQSIAQRILPPQGQTPFASEYHMQEFRTQKDVLRGPPGMSAGGMAMANLGEPDGTLGAVSDKKLVCTWIPDQCPDYDKHTPATQAELATLAKESRHNYFAAVEDLKKDNGCDATVPGRLAGALREYLIDKGGKLEMVGGAEDTFGAHEMDEWIKVFGKPPTYEDAKAAVGTKAIWPSNGWPLNLDTICGKNVKLPTTTVAPGPAPPPPPPTAVTKKKSKAGWLLLAGSAVTALFYAMK